MAERNCTMLPVCGFGLAVDTSGIEAGLSKEEVQGMIDEAIKGVPSPQTGWETLIEGKAWKFPNGMILQTEEITIDSTEPVADGTNYCGVAEWTYPVSFTTKPFYINGSTLNNELGVEFPPNIDEFDASQARVWHACSLKSSSNKLLMIALGF